MKKLLFLFLLLSPTLGATQVLPSSYSEDEIRQMNLEYERLIKEWDVVLPPIVRPIRPTMYNMQEGNWANQWLGTSEHHQQLLSRLKTPVLYFILDTAPKFTNSYLDDFAWNELGKSFTGEEELVDGHGHGHHVAGCIGAINGEQPLGVGRAGVLKGKFKAVPVEVLNDSGAGSYGWITEGVYYALETWQARKEEYPVGIINMSLGGGGSNPQLDQALKAAKDAGMIVLVAAGNTYREGLQYPGSSPHTYAVGSIDSDGRKSNFSSWGDGLWVVAPGRSILSTYPDNQLAVASGTSMATPIQAGIVGLAASIHGGPAAEKLMRAIETLTTDIEPDGWDKETGFGYSYIRQILEYDFDGQPDPPAPEPSPTKKSNRIEVVLPGPYTISYQAGKGRFKDITLKNLHISFRTKGYSQDVLPEVFDEVEKFFQGRGMTLTKKADDLRAGYWAGKFLSIHLKKHNFRRVRWIDAIVIGSGVHGVTDQPPLIDLFNVSRRATFKL